MHWKLRGLPREGYEHGQCGESTKTVSTSRFISMLMSTIRSGRLLVWMGVFQNGRGRGYLESLRIIESKTCEGFQTYLMLDGAVIRLEDIRELPREWRLRLSAASMEQRGGCARRDAGKEKRWRNEKADIACEGTVIRSI